MTWPAGADLPGIVMPYQFKNKNKEQAGMLPFGGSFLLTLVSLFSGVLLSYHPTSWVFPFLYPLENSSRKIHFAPLSGFFYQFSQSAGKRERFYSDWSEREQSKNRGHHGIQMAQMFRSARGD